jgi:trans-o-hydroxybenzylidenepyruvate hydratase-aldolase
MATRQKLLTIDRVQGAWAIMPTPARADASDWRVTDTVDLDETARAVGGLVDAGIDGILSLGTLGECATLTWEEKKKFIATAVEATRGRIPFFAGTTCLGTRETIRQTREACELGASGTMLGLPMWCAADLKTAVKFYKDVAEACPEMAICVYANIAAFRFTFPTEFWAQVSEIPQVITAKYGAVPNLAADIVASKKRVRFMPIDMHYCDVAQLDPEFNTAFWSSGAVCGPDLAVRLRDEVARAKASKDWAAAQELTAAIGKTVWPLIPNGNFEEFNKYNIGLEKARIDAGGWMKAGPCRPPYVYVPEDYMKGARASGAGWAELAQKVRA